MAQTNVQVPIERGHQHDVEVLEPRKILRGDERYKSPGLVHWRRMTNQLR